MNKLHLFPDSNIFLHYKPIPEFDWSKYDRFDEIDIIVCRTVQREIDNLKDGRVGRRTRRARSTASKFLELAENGPQEQRTTSPKVTLKLDIAARPSQEHGEDLDYSQPDDQIVGYVARFRADNPDADARILTRDSGPIMTAKSVCIPYEIPDDAWRLEPEQDDRDQEIRKLTEEVKELRQQEPQFKIKCLTQEGKLSDSIRIDYNLFLPLEQDEKDRLIETLLLLYPPAVRAQNANSLGSRYLGFAIPKESIARYETQEHPDWLAKCRRLLPEVHSIIQAGHLPEITLEVQNCGSRPAINARIDIQAKGQFSLTHPILRLQDVGLIPEKRRPVPPRQPKPVYDLSSFLGGYLSPNLPPFPLVSPVHKQRDKEGFYYTEATSLTPQKSVSLTCDLWRHALEQEDFTVRAVPDTTNGGITGEIVCTVHAENLSKPISRKFIVTLCPNQLSTLSYAIEWFTTPGPTESED